jgi:tetratricopeptide (TPR) repeat protein
MNMPDPLWEERITALWTDIDSHAPESFRAQVDQLAAELPEGNAIASFERACAYDSTGHPDQAVPLYRAALHAGLTGLRRRRATIQLASSLRNLGDAEQAAALLREELDAGSDELDGAVRAFLALALVDLNQEREAAALSLTALAHYLPRYNRSLVRYAEAIGPALGKR